MTETQMHSVERTSSKSRPFRGTCRLCGRENMTAEDVSRADCPNLRGLTEDEAVVEAVKGKP